MTHTIYVLHKSRYLEAIDKLERWYRFDSTIPVMWNCPFCGLWDQESHNGDACPICPWRLFRWKRFSHCSTYANHLCGFPTYAGDVRRARPAAWVTDSLARLASWRKRIEEW